MKDLKKTRTRSKKKNCTDRTVDAMGQIGKKSFRKVPRKEKKRG